MPGGIKERATRIVSSEPLHEGWPPVARHLVEFEDGRRRHWLSLDFPDGAAVLALTRERKLVLGRHHVIGLDEPTYILPGGAVEPGEMFEETARRELLEEAGYRATRLEPLFTYSNFPSYTRGNVHLFLALDVEPAPAAERPIEVERVQLFDVEEAVAMAARGGFAASATAMAVLALPHILARHGL